MRVLLISAHNYTGPWSGACPVPPIGLAYVAAETEKQGHDVSFLDLSFSRAIEHDIKQELKRCSPEVVGISIRNIDNTLMLMPESYVDHARLVTRVCREHCEATIVLGGAGFSIMPRELLVHCGADYGVIGEGEVVFPQLLSHLQTNEINFALPQVICLDDRSPAEEASYIADLDASGPPARKLYLDQYLSQSSTKMGLTRPRESIQTKRGCPLKCIYCTYPRIEGRQVRQRSAKSVADEIERMVAEKGVKDIEFVDSTFNIPSSHAVDICNEIINRKLDITWTGCINPGQFDARLVWLMKEAGCYRVEIGADSCSDTILKALRKNFNRQDIIKLSEACRNAEIEFSHYIILGAPQENGLTLGETFAALEECDPDDILITPGLRIYPNTELADWAHETGAISQETNLLYPTYYFSPEVYDHIGLILDYANARPNWHFVTTAGLRDMQNRPLELRGKDESRSSIDVV